MENNIKVGGSCTFDAEGNKICELRVDDKRAVVKLLPNGDKKLMSNPNNMTREEIVFALSKTLKDEDEEF